jgi:PAS domain S-box-containing protein
MIIFQPYCLNEVETYELASFQKHRDAWLDFSVETVFTESKKVKVLLSRRVENQAAEFSGVIVAVVDPIYFYDRYDDYLDIDVDSVVLTDIHGAVLTTWSNQPYNKEKRKNSHIQPGQPVSTLPKAILSGGGLKIHENSEAIISIYQLTGFPFQIAVSYQKKSTLKKWRQETKRDIIIISVSTLTALLTLLLAVRQRQRRRKAEFQVARHQIHLEEMVEERTLQLAGKNNMLAQKNVELEETLKALSEGEERLSLAVESAQIGIWDLDLKNDKLIWDKRVFSIYGIQPDLFEGGYEAWQKWIHPEDLPQMDEAKQQAIKGKKPFDTEFRVVWPSGEVRHVRAIARVTHETDGRAVRMTGVNLDITEAKKVEEALRESERLHGVLEMAGAVCHEMNQPLQALFGFSELLALKQPENDAVIKTVGQITKQIERLRKINLKLMNIAHYETKQYLDVKIIDIEKSTSPKMKR